MPKKKAYHISFLKSILTIIFFVVSQTLLAFNVDSLFQKASALLETNYETSVATVLEAENDIQMLNSNEQSLFFNQAANFFHSLGDFKTEARFLKKLVALLPADSDTLHASLIDLGYAQTNYGALDSGLYNFKRGEAYYLEFERPLKLARAFSGIAAIRGYKGDSELSITYYLKSIELFEKYGASPLKLSHVHSNMAMSYVIMDNHQKALETRKKAHHYALTSNSEFDIHFCEMNLGESFGAINQFDSAIYYLEAAESFFKNSSNLRVLSSLYSNLGVAYSKNENNPLAEAYFEKAIGILKTQNFDLGLASALGNYGRVLYQLEKYSKGILVAREGYQIARKVNILEIEKQTSESLYLNFKGRKVYDSALYYFEVFQMLEDSVKNVDLQKAVLKKELESTYSKEKESIISDANAEIKEEVNLRNLWILGFLGALIVLIVLFWVYRHNRRLGEAIQKEKQYLDNLLHNLVHEFRTPLTLIKGPTEELLKSDSENNLLKLVDKNSDHMLKLVNQILDFAKIKAGRLEIFEQPTPLQLFLEDTIELFNSSANQKHITISLKNNSPEAIIKVDSDKLFKIVSNLLSNAIKYSENNTNVIIEAKIEQKLLTLIFKDEGIGISPANHEKVFNKFYQADATITRKGEGTGLGLAFTKELINLMKGSIELDSKLNIGSTFTVKIPVSQISTQNETATINLDSKDPQMTIDKATPKPEKDTSKLLIIEDNTDMQYFLRQILEVEQYEIFSAFDGEAGIEAAIDILPDLIISDVMMPKKDGFQVVQELKENNITEHIPIIMLTAKGSFDSMIEGLEYGADDYISKPFKAQELLLRISNQISRQEKLREKYQSAQEPLKVKHNLISKIEALTLEDSTQQYSVEELAKRCALSRSQLHRKLKQLTGLSTSEFLTKIRLDLAVVDIKNSDMSISEIAYKYGYSDPAHFTKLFKKQFKRTPSEVRK